eukprot:GILI01019707.1.p1 GENE.GILI01019707.1~~GILI01019707.1.p1  ORF type:complete len:453 (+),score=98.31 GILI01019707.1:90-1448(+)
MSDEDRRPFYVVLGVPTDASQATIKRAYHQMALIYHPDKAGPEGIETFKRVQAAYTVLGDPDKRRIYDRFGERGLDMPGVDQLAGLLGQQVSASLLFIILFLVYALLIIFCSFLCVRVQRKVDWNWTSVWIPLYILFGLIALLLVLSIPSVLLSKKKVVAEENAEGDEVGDIKIVSIGWGDRLLQLNGIAVSLGWIIFIFCISAGLQRNMDGKSVNWWRYFVPVFIAEALTIFGYILDLRSFPDKLRARSLVPIGDGVINGLALASLLLLLCRASQLALIAARVEGTLTDSWWVIFIPSYCFLGAFAMQLFFTQLLQKPGPRNIAAYYCSLCCGPICCTIFLLGLPIASLIMIIAKLAGNDITLQNALIPVFIILAFGVLAGLLGAIAMCCQAAVTSSDLHEMEEAGSGDVNEPSGAGTTQQSAGQTEQTQTKAVTYGDNKPAETATANIDE